MTLTGASGRRAASHALSSQAAAPPAGCVAETGSSPARRSVGKGVWFLRPGCGRAVGAGDLAHHSQACVLGPPSPVSEPVLPAVGSGPRAPCISQGLPGPDPSLTSVSTGDLVGQPGLVSPGTPQLLALSHLASRKSPLLCGKEQLHHKLFCSKRRTKRKEQPEGQGGGGGASRFVRALTLGLPGAGRWTGRGSGGAQSPLRPVRCPEPYLPSPLSLHRPYLSCLPVSHRRLSTSCLLLLTPGSLTPSSAQPVGELSSVTVTRTCQGHLDGHLHSVRPRCLQGCPGHTHVHAPPQASSHE